MLGDISEERLKLDLAGHSLSCAAVWPAEPVGGMTAAHGLINDLDHPSLIAACRGAAEQGWAGLRFNFPYRERKPHQPGLAEEVDPFPVLTGVHRAAAEWIGGRGKGGLVLAGKSMGGRTAAQLAAEGLDCQGVIFLSYPLHDPDQPSRKREGVLKKIKQPLLFVQGGQDVMGRRDLMSQVVADLGERASIRFIDQADHGLDLPEDAAMTPAQAMDIIRSEVADFIGRLA